MFFKKTKLLMLGFLMIVLAACGSDDGDADNEASDDGETIEIGQINWPENVAVTNMWKAILDDEGYDLDITLLEMGAQMQGIADGDLDIAPEVWLPVQDKSYVEQYDDEAYFADEPWYDNGKVGLIVPEYMDDIDSIDDLNEHKDEFDGEIAGFEPGAGTMEVTEDVVDEYDLDLELIQSSEAAMITTIQEAYKNEEPVVAPLWKPQRVFSEMDLKFLDDPKDVYGGVEEIFHATREDFEDDFPEIAEWLDNWEMDDDELNELMTDVDDADDELDGAKKWVEENQDLVDEWLEK